MKLTKEKTIIRGNKVLILLFIIFFTFFYDLSAQTDPEEAPQQTNRSDIDPAYIFPAGRYWSLDAGAGMSGLLVNGVSFHFLIDPKLWLSPALMVGAKAGLHYSRESKHEYYSDILTLEGQVYLRWNFARLGKNPEKKFNMFLQGGIGLISAYRGMTKIGSKTNPFNDVTETRGSFLADAALGVTIPLTARWHLEPLIRGGYPHLWGASITAGYKFPLPESKTIREEVIRTQEIIRTQEVVKTLPANELIKIIRIASIEFVLFGPDIGRYNIGIDRDAQQLNELVLIQTAKVLRENPDFRVRLEGHANPYTINKSEEEDLLALSAMRAETIAQQLKERGVREEQMVIVSFGGTRNATSEWDIRNRNRRVEIMIIQIDTE